VQDDTIKFVLETFFVLQNVPTNFECGNAVAYFHEKFGTARNVLVSEIEQVLNKLFIKKKRVEQVEYIMAKMDTDSVRVRVCACVCVCFLLLLLPEIGQMGDPPTLFPY
jgi:hypothetical protein